MRKLQATDYLELLNKYDALSNGEKASIRREVEADDLRINPVFYRLIQGTELANKVSQAQAARLVYFLPFVRHKAHGKKMGEVLKDNNISERRLFLVVRSEYPNDLTQLRRLLQQVKPYAVVDWSAFGEMLFWWGKNKEKSEASKRRLMQDFYLSSSQQPQKITEV
jgi:CRISPR system Cascade subunit CasB